MNQLCPVSVNQIIRFYLLGVTALLLSACTIGSPDESVAAKTTQSFYKALQAGDFESALKACSDKRSPEQWRLHLDHVKENLGTVKTFKPLVTEVNTVLSGRYYILEFFVVYDSGKEAKETITLFDSVDTDDMPLIVSHVISADGYRPLF